MTTSINRRLLFTGQAKKELHKLPPEIRVRFMKSFHLFRSGDELTIKLFKKLSGNELYEFRVKGLGGIYRGLCYQKRSELIVGRIFHKKTDKTPLREIDTAIKRIKIFLDDY